MKLIIYDIDCDLINNIYTETMNVDDTGLFNSFFSKLALNLYLTYVHDMEIFKIGDFTYFAFYDLNENFSDSIYYLIKTSGNNWMVKCAYPLICKMKDKCEFRNFFVQNNILVCIEDNGKLQNICVLSMYDIEKDRIIYEKSKSDDYLYGDALIHLEKLSLPFHLALQVAGACVHKLFKNPSQNIQEINFSNYDKHATVYPYHGLWNDYIYTFIENDRNYLLLYDMKTKMFEEQIFGTVADISLVGTNLIVCHTYFFDFPKKYTILSKKSDIKKIGTYDIRFNFQ